MRTTNDDRGRLNWKRLLRTTREDWIKKDDQDDCWRLNWKDDWGRQKTTGTTTKDDRGRLNWKERLKTTKNDRWRLQTCCKLKRRLRTTELKRTADDDQGRLNWKGRLTTTNDDWLTTTSTNNLKTSKTQSMLFAIFSHCLPVQLVQPVQWITPLTRGRLNWKDDWVRPRTTLDDWILFFDQSIFFLTYLVSWAVEVSVGPLEKRARR